MLDKVYVVHFSPAGNTRKAALMLAGELAAQVEEYDLTHPLGGTAQLCTIGCGDCGGAGLRRPASRCDG